MQLVININERLYKIIKTLGLVVEDEDAAAVSEAIRNGIPLPKGHGDLIDRKLALNDDGLYEFHRYDDYVKMRNYLKSIPTIIESDNEG